MSNKGYKKIPLGSSDKYALVSEADYSWISRWKWHERNGYAIRVIWLNPEQSQRLTIQMHSVIMPTSGNEVVVDHINGNPLDNRRCNLRYCTQKENSLNRKKQSTWNGEPTSSEYKGVSSKDEFWVAQIRVNGILMHLGRFLSEIDAAHCYDSAAVEYFQEFARLNFPGNTPKKSWRELASEASQEIQSDKNYTSKYSGVSWNIKNKKWIAIYSRDGGPGYMGLFSTEEAAARCVDAAAAKFSGSDARLNFPNEIPSQNWEILLEKKTTSKYRGVSFVKKHARWKAAFRTGGKQIWGGYWDSEEDAARAYDKLAKKYLGEKARLNFPEATP